MMPCCSVSLFKLKFSASIWSTARTPPFFRRTVSLRISPMGTKRWVEAKMFFLRSRTVLLGNLMTFFRFMIRIVEKYRGKLRGNRHVLSGRWVHPQRSFPGPPHGADALRFLRAPFQKVHAQVHPSLLPLFPLSRYRNCPKWN